jgi:hypothetical protein
MREGKLATFFAGALIVLSSAVAYAAPAPKELYGKSVVLIWSVNLEGTTRHVLRAGFNVVLTTYVSTAGRLFTQVWQGGGAGSHAQRNAVTYEAPGDRTPHSSAEFQGHSLVITSQFEGGARRIVADFDPSFSTCQAKVIHGKELGKNTMHYTDINGQPIELHSVTVSNVTCAIKEGNALSGS